MSCLASVVPGINGACSNSSPNTHPTPHMSTAFCQHHCCIIKKQQTKITPQQLKPHHYKTMHGAIGGSTAYSQTASQHPATPPPDPTSAAPPGESRSQLKAQTSTGAQEWVTQGARGNTSLSRARGQGVILSIKVTNPRWQFTWLLCLYWRAVLYVSHMA